MSGSLWCKSAGSGAPAAIVAVVPGPMGRPNEGYVGRNAERGKGKSARGGAAKGRFPLPRMGVDALRRRQGEGGVGGRDGCAERAWAWEPGWNL